MGQIGSIIADTASVGVRMAGRLVNDIPAERFGRFAAPAGQIIVSNHPAFALGHLCLYPLKVHQLLEQDTSSVQPPSQFEALFSRDATCQDDAQGTLYPPSAEIIDFFNRSYAAAQATLRNASDTQLSADNPLDTPMKQFCPTLGALLNFYMTGHVTNHLGQISAWRRMQGLKPA